MRNRLYSQSAAIFFGAALLIYSAPAALAGEAKDGKALYDKLCASCHGADGKGNPAMIKAMGEKGLNLTTKAVKEAKDDELMKVIVDGRGKMPAAGKNLSATERKQVLEYTRSLAK